MPGSKVWKILITEPDEGNLLLLKSWLGQDFEVVCVSDGREAWDRVLRESFDLVITDLKLREMNGNILVEYINLKFPERGPILAYTSQIGLASQLLREKKIDGVVSKSAKLKVLVDAIRRKILSDTSEDTLAFE